MASPHDPFSAVAGRYDADFSSLPGVARIRERMVAAAKDAFPPRCRVLDLGCGTGEDAVRLAREGYRVTAADVAPAMLALTAERAREAGIPLTVQSLNARSLEIVPAGSFDGLYSNFGVVNLVDDLGGFFLQCHRILSPGGAALICLLGRYSPWEIASFLARGEASRAFRRLQSGAVDVPIGGESVPVRYFPTSSVIASARARFTLIRSYGINVVSPPPSSTRMVRRFPRIASTLWDFEPHVASLYPFSRAGDHVAFLFRRLP